MKGRVVIIEDERELGELIQLYLDKEGIEGVLCASAEEGLATYRSDGADLIVLDINLPGMDGFEFLQDFRRESSVPVIIVSARESDEDIVMRPFPQIATGGTSLADQWTTYRKAMIEHAGIAVFVFGNKLDPAGDMIPSNGMRQEFDLCIEAGVRPLPIGTTGYMAEILWKEVCNDFKKFYPGATPAFRDEFEKLGDNSTALSDLIPVIQNLIEQLQRG